MATSVKVYAGQYDTGSIAAADIGAGAVVEAKLGSGAVTEDKLGAGAVTSGKIGAGAILAAALAAAAKQSVLESKVVLQDVFSAERSSPAGTTENVGTDSEWDFNVTAGAIGSSGSSGIPVLLEAAGVDTADAFNTTSGKPGTASDPGIYKILIIDANGDEIADGSGDPVWGVITTADRTIAGAAGDYKLRFFTGEYGSGSEATYNLAVAYHAIYPQIVDFYSLDRAAYRKGVARVSAQAAGIAAGQIGSAQLAADAVTAGKIADGAIDAAALFAEGVVDSNALGTGAVIEAKLGAGAVTQTKIGNGAVGTNQLADTSVTSDKLGSGAVTAGKIAAGGVSAADQIAAGTITNTEINASAAITESKLADLGKEGAASLVANIRRRDIEVAGPVHANGAVVNQDTATAGKVTAQGTPDMTVAVAAGACYNAAGTRIDGSANAALAIGAADVTNARYDLVTFDASGVATVTAGTPAGSPTVPALPANHVKLAVVKVAANDTAISNSEIYDHRRPAAPIMRQETFTGDGATLAFALSRRARGAVQVFRGVAPQIEVSGSPATADEYNLNDATEQDGTEVAYNTGYAPGNGQVLTAWYLG